MIVGHQRQIRYLGQVLERGTFAHAYLFFGPEAMGKRTIAMATAQTLLCAKRGVKLGGCGLPAKVLPGKILAGECEDCRLVSRSLHPDLIALSFERPLVKEKNERDPSTSLRASIGIENIHELQRRLALSAWRGGRKVVIIDQAEALSRAAQAALLKILEEPDAKTVFFLITRSPDALLPTVRSRCVPVGFTALSDDELLPLTADISASQAREFLALAGGRPGVLVRLMRDEKFREERRVASERSSRLRAMDLAAAFAFADAHARDEGTMVPALVHLLQSVRGDLHAAIENAGAGLAGSRDEGIARRTAFLATLLERLRIFETTTVNRRLLADSVFFEFSALGTRKP